MNSVWQSLLWKEWREHRWKAALLVAACVAVPLGAAAAFWDWAAILPVAAVMLGLCVPAVAMFVGAALAAGERSGGTSHFLQALPAPMWKAASAKMIVGSGMVLAPTVLASAAALAVWTFARIFSVYAGISGPSDALVIVAVASGVLGATALSLLVWSAAAGVNHSDELRAGAIALLIISSVWAALFFVANQFVEKYGDDWPKWAAVTAAAMPGGVAYHFDLVEGRLRSNQFGNRWDGAWPYAAIFLVSHAALVAWYVRRLGRGAKPSATADLRQTALEPRVITKTTLGWLAPPRRSRLTAIAWKQFRESAPLAALGALAIFIVGLVVARVTPGLTAVETLETLQLSTMTVWMIAGVFVSVVAGIGLFYDDLRPGLHTFWRSRPIPVDGWFWDKLVVGLMLTVGILATGPMASLAVVKAFGGVTWPGRPSLPEFLGFGLLLHAATFLLAVLAIVLLRQPVVAAIATIAVGLALAVCAELWLERRPTTTDEDLAIALGALAIVAAMFPLLAWKALRRDWGWKG